MFFKKKCSGLYNLYDLHSFLGLGHILVRFFFVKIFIIRFVIGLMAKYHLDFSGLPYDLMLKILGHIYQGLRFIF